ncbi:hypothetical protein MUA01_09735 [Enterobacteriaceae bacterium H18W14]|uniref:hypothetical protein n=1 Tax=Dryocola boscaweniae TaxID=2925397 RepID=UPI0022F006EF|nr:hypothetical protein [Dryocola boscaweniae]MCT4715256.1 hypothetical protein [Dryocola boscaweniae]
MNIHSGNVELSCTSSLKKELIAQDGSKAILDTDVYLFLDGKGQGFTNYDGIVSYNNNDYRVKRLINFTYSHQEKATVYNITWRGSEVASEDTLPPGKLTLMVNPLAKKIFYQFKKLDDKTILVLRDGLPVLGCALG